jgi:hypothetical protein
VTQIEHHHTTYLPDWQEWFVTKPQLTRRDFLTLLMGGTAGAGLLALERWQQFYQETLLSQRTLRPRLLTSVPDSSVGFGLSPTADNLFTAQETARLLNTKLSAVNFFLKGFGHRGDHWHHHARMAGHLGITPILSWGHSQFSERDLFQLCEYFKSIEFPIIFRPYFEMNSTWAADWWWAGEKNPPRRLQELWFTLREAFLRYRVSNVQMCWCPHDTVNPFITHSFAAYYPGDEVVDLLGLDVYLKRTEQWWDVNHYAHPELPIEAHLGHDLAQLQKLAPEKPLVIAEINSMADSTAGNWLATATRYAAHAGAKLIMPFTWDKPEEFDWRLERNQDIIDSLKTELQSSLYR